LIAIVKVIEGIDQQNARTTIHINIKIVGKHMLDKVLTGENVKLNGEIAGRRHILRTLFFFPYQSIKIIGLLKVCFLVCHRNPYG
jgi:hypothetical protein